MCYTDGAGQGRDTGALVCQSLYVPSQPHTVVARAPVMSGIPRAVLVGSAGIRRDGGSVMEAEVWKPIPLYPNAYEVSDQGRVRRITTQAGTYSGRLLHGTTLHGKYLGVRLSLNGEVRGWFIHRLVAIAFIGPVPSGCVVNHIDANKHNNALANLEYVTPQANVQHAVRLGLHATGERSGQRRHPELFPRGEASPTAKLRRVDVEAIRTTYDSGETTQRKLAQQYGVSQGQIGRILNNLSWRLADSGGNAVQAAAARQHSAGQPPQKQETE